MIQFLSNPRCFSSTSNQKLSAFRSLLSGLCCTIALRWPALFVSFGPGPMVQWSPKGWKKQQKKQTPKTSHPAWSGGWDVLMFFSRMSAFFLVFLFNSLLGCFLGNHCWIPSSFFVGFLVWSCVSNGCYFPGIAKMTNRGTQQPNQP